MGSTAATGQTKLKYDCDKCIAYCCSIYDRVQVTPRDIRRLAAHFRVLPEVATQRFTKLFGKERILRRKADRLFGQACTFLDQDTRKCTIYEARPLVCHEFPTTSRCAYYDLIEFERDQQNDPDAIPLVKITFKNGSK
ncbi:MAG TPA: YkgJ family cysteine cluster protein [Pyrinomonadaceae bacterium]|jgi:Fe-S-cluster containining protein|nr:YkgJ family cysteine cluster protein [Pyrinomonadaceae bacterium]